MNQQDAELVLDVLMQHGYVAGHAGWLVEVAPGGSTDRTFSVRDAAGERRLTVRIARPGLVDWLRQEARVLTQLEAEATAAIWTPRNVRLVEDDRLPGGVLLVHDYLPGQPAPLADIALAGREQLGECLAWLHGHRQTTYAIWPSIAARSGTRADAYRARIDSLRSYRSADGSMTAVGEMIEALGKLDLASTAGWQEQDFALCHGDLSIGNILWDGDTVALIDWEFARPADPAEEIAYLVAEQDLSPDLVGDVAEAYIGAGGDPWAFARLPVWLPLVALDAALWWADDALVAGESQPDTAAKVSERLDRAQSYLRQSLR